LIKCFKNQDFALLEPKKYIDFNRLYLLSTGMLKKKIKRAKC